MTVLTNVFGDKFQNHALIGSLYNIVGKFEAYAAKIVGAVAFFY